MTSLICEIPKKKEKRAELIETSKWWLLGEGVGEVGGW